MDKKTRLLIMHAEAGVLSAAIQMQLAKHSQDGFKVITPDQAKERVLSFSPSPSTMADRVKEIISEKLTESKMPFTPPMSRRERRAANRKKR